MKRKKLLVPLLFLMILPPKGTLQLAVFRPFPHLGHTAHLPRTGLQHATDTYSSPFSIKFFNPQLHFLQLAATFSSTSGIKYFNPRQQILLPVDKNFFSGLEIYFRSLEIYFSAAEIYFQATEIVLLREAKQFIAGGKTIYRGRQRSLSQAAIQFVAGGKTICCGRQRNLLRAAKKFIAGGKTICCGRKRSLQPAAEGLGVRADRHSSAGYRLLMR